MDFVTGGAGVIVAVDTSPETTLTNRVELINDPTSTLQCTDWLYLQELENNRLAMLRLQRDVMAMRIIKPSESRNQSEGRYYPKANPDKDAPQCREFKRERKRGHYSRKLNAQFFNNYQRAEGSMHKPHIVGKP